jgi:hypothetical protein
MAQLQPRSVLAHLRTTRPNRYQLDIGRFAPEAVEQMKGWTHVGNSFSVIAAITSWREFIPVF